MRVPRCSIRSITLAVPTLALLSYSLPMNGAQLKEHLRGGGVIHGTMVNCLRDPRLAAIYGQLGFEFAVLDTEHSPNDRGVVADASAAFLAAGVCPIVRVPTTAPADVIMALDGGAHGVLVPYCESPEEVRAVVTAARLRPLKGARLARVIGGGDAPGQTTRDYLAKRNSNVVIFIGIESVPAVENLEAILDAGEAAGGIDGFMIGPNDLSISLDVPDQLDHPKYVAAVEHIIKVAAARGVVAGPHCMTGESALMWREKGARFMLLSSDWRSLAEGYRPILTKLRGDTGLVIKKPA